MKNEKQGGSITVEATLFLPIFFFAFLSIYNLVYFARAQLIVQYAVDQAAKEVAQYSYILEKTGIIQDLDNLEGKAEKFKSDLKTIGDNLGTIQEAGENVLQGEDVIQNSIEVGKTANNLLDTVKTYVEDPQSFIEGILSCFKGDIAENITKYMVNVVAKSCVYKQLSIAGGNTDPLEYMENLGISSLSFSETSWCKNKSRDVKIVEDYDATSNLPFFSMAPRHFRVCASTRIWSGV
ncbi:MAG: TadE/TadG family type IV pilus assembly protein [Oliverpabstia sp.]